MPLYRIAYYAVANPKTIDEYQVLFDRMSEEAVRLGEERDMTGVFVASGYWIYQVLEGRRRVVSDLLGEIYAGSEQLAVQVVMAAPISRRLFSRMWGVARPAPNNADVIRRYSGATTFEPGSMSPAALCAMAYELTEAFGAMPALPLLELDEVAWDDKFTPPLA